MRSSPSIWSKLAVLVLALVTSILPGCTCEGARQQENRSILACQAKQKTTIAPPLQSKQVVSGAIAVLLSVAESSASLTIPLESIPGRAGMEPGVSLHYNSDNNSDYGVGVGFSLAAGSSITRRNKTLAIDGFVDVPHYDESDVFAIDGKPLVEVARSVDEIEYRTFPDSQIRVIQKGTIFESFLPDGRKILYGAQPRARTGEPRAWLATEQVDPREKIFFDWCIAGNDQYDSEYALTSIRYGHENVIAFVYEARDETQTRFVGGMQLQESVRLSEVQMFHEETLVRRYALTYETSETTSRTLLTSVQLCAASGECFVPTTFQYRQPTTGFDDITIDIAAPLSDKASPMFLISTAMDIPNTSLAIRPPHQRPSIRSRNGASRRILGERLHLKKLRCSKNGLLSMTPKGRPIRS